MKAKTMKVFAFFVLPEPGIFMLPEPGILCFLTGSNHVIFMKYLFNTIFTKSKTSVMILHVTGRIRSARRRKKGIAASGFL